MRLFLVLLSFTFFINSYSNEPVIKIYMDKIEINGINFYSNKRFVIQEIKEALNGERYVKRKLNDGNFRYTFVKSKLTLYSSDKNKDFYEMQFPFLKVKQSFKGEVFILNNLFSTDKLLCFDLNDNQNYCIYPNRDEPRMKVFKSEESRSITNLYVRIHYAPWPNK